MSAAKKVIQGDYYEIDGNGSYQKHKKVKVHCHDNETQLSEVHKNEQMMPKVVLHPISNKTLEKQEVRSVHYEQTFQQNRHKSKTPRDLTRSTTNNEISPKKGILKRSLIDKKEQELKDAVNIDHENGSKVNVPSNSSSDQNEYKTEKSNKIKNLANEIKREHELRESLQSQYQNMMHRFRSVSSEVQQDLNGVEQGNMKTERSHRNRRQIEREINRKSLARTFRQNEQSRSRNQSRHQRKRSHHKTDGETVVYYKNSPHRKINEGEEFEHKVFSQIDAIIDKLRFLQQQIKASEERMLKYHMEKQLQEKEVLIKKMERENQLLRLPHQPPAAKDPITDVSDTLFQYFEKKLPFIASFFIIVFLCMIMSRSGPTCQKID